jgi:hypothetical protein
MTKRAPKKSPLDEQHAFLHAMPQLKKEGFVLLVRTKTRKDLRALKMKAVRDDEPDLEKFYEAAETLRTYIEAGIPLTL